VDVPGAVVDGEGGAGALAAQDVPDGAVAFVHVRVELGGGVREHVLPPKALALREHALQARGLGHIP